MHINITHHFLHFRAEFLLVFRTAALSFSYYKEPADFIQYAGRRILYSIFSVSTVFMQKGAPCGTPLCERNI